MRREKLFSNHGFYPFIVDSNVLLHRQAVDQGRIAVERLLKQRDPQEPVHVLDLACGGEPVAIANIMAHFSDRRFHYTGVDINPDQIEQARSWFKFSHNVKQVILGEGNAWDFHPAESGRKYDLIFMGLNLHHGTPEEVYYLATRIDQLMANEGIFVNHDCFRPDHEPYFRRPDAHPDHPEASFQLLSRDLVSSHQALPFVLREVSNGAPEPEWRLRYRHSLSATATERGGDLAGIESMNQHVKLRDYPVSLQEFRAIFESLGFEVTTRRYDTRDPLGEFIAMAVAGRQGNS